MFRAVCGVIVAGTLALVVGSARADDEKPKKENAGQPDKAAILKKFDANGDGKLSDEEAAKAKEALGKLAPDGKKPEGKEAKPPFTSKEEVLKKFDKNGNGELDPEEKQAAIEAYKAATGKNAPEGKPALPSKEEIIKKFDKNGDGELNAEEKKAAMEAYQVKAPAEGKQLPSKEEIIKKFDKNGDGELNDEEKKAAIEAYQKNNPKDAPEKKPAQDKNAVAKPNIEELTRKFDKDGDGKLNDDEKRAAYEAFQANRPKDSPEKKPAPEKTSAAKPNVEEIIKKFDKDGDGKLNEDEKRAAYEAIQGQEKKVPEKSADKPKEK